MCIRDRFSNGELWRVALKRYGCPTQLTLELDPFKADVYYDLPDVYKRQEVGSLDIPLDFVEKNTALTLKVRIGDSISAYPIWVYRCV